LLLSTRLFGESAGSPFSNKIEGLNREGIRIFIYSI